MLNFSPELKMGGDRPYLFKGSKPESPTIFAIFFYKGCVNLLFFFFTLGWSILIFDINWWHESFFGSSLKDDPFPFSPKWLGNWIAPISPEATLQKRSLEKIQFCSSENLVFCWGSLLWFSMHHWRFWIQYVVLLIRLFFRWTNKMSDWRYTTQWRSTCRPYWLIDIWS